MFGAFFRLLRPVRLIKRRALLKGLLGGDRTWLVLGIIVWLGGKIRSLFGGGEPVAVYTEEIGSGERFVLAHVDAPTKKRRKR